TRESRSMPPPLHRRLRLRRSQENLSWSSARSSVLAKEEEFIPRRLNRTGHPPSIKAVYVPQRTCLPITRRAAGLLVPKGCAGCARTGGAAVTIPVVPAIISDSFPRPAIHRDDL